MKKPVDRRTRKDEHGLSFSEVTRLVEEALAALYAVDEEHCGPWVREIWEDRCVFSWEGKSWQAPYVLSVTEAGSQVTLGEAEEVKSAFVPVKDGATVVRVDFLQEIHWDPRRDDGIRAMVDENTGFLTLEGLLTRTGVFEYQDAEGNRWGELRTEDEVFSEESMASFRQVVVTNEHPDAFVDVNNVKDVGVGHVGTDVRRDGDFLRATVTITDAKTIIAVMNGKKQLSCGYTTVVQDAKGELGGKRYDVRQTKIRGNHLAVVDVGRAGPDCALLTRGDGAAFTKGTTMPTKKKDTQASTKPKVQQLGEQLLLALKADNEKRTDEGAQAQAEGIIELLTQALKTGNEMIIAAAVEMVMKGNAEKPAEEPTSETTSEGGAEGGESAAAGAGSSEEQVASADEATKLRARVVALESGRDQDKKDAEAQLAAVRDLAKLEATALKVVPTLVVDSKLSVADARRFIMQSVVTAVMPGRKDSVAADVKEHGEGYLRALYDEALKLHADRARHLDAAARLAFEAHEVEDSANPEVAYEDYLTRTDKLSRLPAGQTLTTG